MTAEPKAPIYRISILHRTDYGVTIDWEGDTVERACDAALRYAKRFFNRLQPEPVVHRYVVTEINCPSADHAGVSVPRAYRAPISGIDHRERCMAIAALRVLANHLETPAALPLAEAFRAEAGCDAPGGAELEALADRFDD